MRQVGRALSLYQALLLSVGLLASAAPRADLDSAIDQLTQLSYQASTSEMARQLAPLLERLDEASPAQRARVGYLQVRLLGLQGHYQRSLELADQLLAQPMPPESALPLTRLAANMAVNAGRQELAFEYLRRALLLLETNDEPFEHAGILGLSSQLQIEAGNSDLAVAHALAGVSQAERIDDPRIHCGAAVRAAAALIANQAIDQALAIAIPALSICRKTGEAALIGSMLNEVANAYLELGQTTPVGPLLDEAEALLAGHYYQGALFSRLLALRWLLTEGRPQSVLDLSEPLTAEFERLGLWRRMNDALELEALAHLQLNDTAASYQARQRQLMARQRYLDHERLLALAHAEVDFEARRGQQQLVLLHEQARINTLRDQAQQGRLRLRLMTTGLTVAVLILLGLLLAHALTERRHFQRIAQHDGLTGLPNHTRFFEQAEQLVAQQRQDHRHRPLTLVMADLDHFKQVNDQYGHLVGDEILRSASAAFQRALGEHGTLGRIGGEEFAACLPNHGTGAARRHLEDLRRRLNERLGQRLDRPVTMSFGLAELIPGEGLDSLRSRADQALYKAKNLGRDRAEAAPAAGYPAKAAGSQS